MYQLMLLAYMLASMLGSDPADIACWRANPSYVPRESYAAACVLDADGDPLTVKPAAVLDWDGTIRILPLVG